MTAVGAIGTGADASVNVTRRVSDRVISPSCSGTSPVRARTLTLLWKVLYSASLQWSELGVFVYGCILFECTPFVGMRTLGLLLSSFLIYALKLCIQSRTVSGVICSETTRTSCQVIL